MRVGDGGSGFSAENPPPARSPKGDSAIRRRSLWATKLFRLRADRGLYILVAAQFSRHGDPRWVTCDSVVE